jgi:flagellar biosynthesis/type III secretory pathway protein FliH
MKEFTEAGREEGLREGEEIGLKKGEELGLKKGEELGMVYAYYDMNLDTKEIAQKMQLTEEEIKDIIIKREK